MGRRKANNTTDKLGPHGSKQQRIPEVVDMLLSGRTVPQIAADTDIAESTIWRWSQTPEFQDRLAAGRRKTLEEGVTALLSITAKAVQTLGGLLSDKDPRVRLKACEIALAQGWKGVETSDLAGQVERMRQKLKEAVTLGKQPRRLLGQQVRQLRNEVRGNGRTGRDKVRPQPVGEDAGPDIPSEWEGAGGDPLGPHADPGLGGDDTRPLAEEAPGAPPPPLFPPEGADQLRETDWQEHGSGSPRTRPCPW